MSLTPSLPFLAQLKPISISSQITLPKYIPTLRSHFSDISSLFTVSHLCFSLTIHPDTAPGYILTVEVQ